MTPHQAIDSSSVLIDPEVRGSSPQLGLTNFGIGTLEPWCPAAQDRQVTNILDLEVDGSRCQVGLGWIAAFQALERSDSVFSSGFRPVFASSA
jgi:hypothetical protein